MLSQAGTAPPELDLIYYVACSDRLTVRGTGADPASRPGRRPGP